MKQEAKGRGGGCGVSWQMFANAKHARISCIFTNFDIYNPLLPARLTNGQPRGAGKGEGQAGNKLKSSLNSFICLWKTLASSYTHTQHTHTHTHMQDTHLNDLWRKWRQVCRLSRPLALGSWPAWQCGQREANVAKSKSSWPKAGGRGGGRGCPGAGSISWRTWAICNMIEINAKPAHWNVCEWVCVCVWIGVRECVCVCPSVWTVVVLSCFVYVFLCFALTCRLDFFNWAATRRQPQLLHSIPFPPSPPLSLCIPLLFSCLSKIFALKWQQKATKRCQASEQQLNMCKSTRAAGEGRREARAVQLPS